MESCSVCRSQFTKTCNVQHHEENHEKLKKPLFCNICESFWECDSKLQRHFVSEKHENKLKLVQTLKKRKFDQISQNEVYQPLPAESIQVRQEPAPTLSREPVSLNQ